MVGLAIRTSNTFFLAAISFMTSSVTTLQQAAITSFEYLASMNADAIWVLEVLDIADWALLNGTLKSSFLVMACYFLQRLSCCF